MTVPSLMTRITHAVCDFYGKLRLAMVVAGSRDFLPLEGGRGRTIIPLSALLLLLCAEDAAAQGVSCTMAAAGGLMSGVMGSFQSCITAAANSYIPQFTSFLTNYFWGAIGLSLTLFGVRTTALAHENFLKEAMGLLFKIAIAAYLFFNALPLYNSLVGAMNEMIGWVGGTASPWGTMDAIWIVLMGANPADVSGASGGGGQTASYYGSMGMMGATALFTNTTGVTVFILGIQAILSVLFMVMRIMLMLLIAYFGLALMMILAPLVAPLLVFSSHNPQSYTKQIFERWYGIILATILEPVFIMAFFGMVVQVLDSFIETGAAITGVSSLSSLLQQCNSSGGGSGSSGNIMGCIEPNSPLASHCQVGDPQAHSSGSSGSSGYGWDWASQQPFPGEAQANQACANGGTMNLTFTRLRANGSSGAAGSGGAAGSAPIAPLSLLVVTLVAIIIITYILEDFVSTMSKVARHIAGAAGLAMFQVSQAPIEGMLNAMTRSAGNAMKQAVKEKGMNPAYVPRTIVKGVQAAGSSAARSVLGGITGND